MNHLNIHINLENNSRLNIPNVRNQIFDVDNKLLSTT